MAGPLPRASALETVQFNVFHVAPYVLRGIFTRRRLVVSLFDRLGYLEGCVLEAMRLWPTTPLLARETVKRDMLGNALVPARTQVLVFNNYHHRDTAAYADADRFVPELWVGSDGEDYRFNHLSNGRQGCAGKHLALFIAKAVLATLLEQAEYRLERPRLNPDRPLPHQYNDFRLKFHYTPR